MTKYQARAARLKAANLCRQCGETAPDPGLTGCSTCRADEKARNQERRDRIVAEGIKCARCPLPVDARGLCYRHYYAVYTKPRREQRRAA